MYYSDSSESKVRKKEIKYSLNNFIFVGKYILIPDLVYVYFIFSVYLAYVT